MSAGRRGSKSVPRSRAHRTTVARSATKRAASEAAVAKATLGSTGGPGRRLEEQIRATAQRFERREDERKETAQRLKSDTPLAANPPDRVRLRLERLGIPRPAIEHAPALAPAEVAGVVVRGTAEPAFTALERVLGRNDLTSVSFLERGLSVSRSVARVRIRDGRGALAGYGTGFLVSPRLLLTNNHVLSAAAEAASSEVEFNYQSGLDGAALPSEVFQLAPDDFFLTDEALDFTLVEYTSEDVQVLHGVEVDECRFHLGTPGHTWIDVAGRPSSDMLRDLGMAFNLHPLALEDVFHGNQRSKLDIFDRQVFLVMNDPAWIDGRLKQRQVSIFFGDNYAISFHEHKDDIFAPVRERIQQPDSRLRARGIDYLVYALVDLVIDRKFPLLQQFGDAVETLEDEALEQATPQTLRQIHMLRRSLYGLHRVQWAERETVHAMMRTEVPLIGAETRTYMRDCRDHSIAVLELVENYREMCSSLMELYMMSTSNRLNEVMKVLAIITTIFMPLSFIAAVYGMNFDTEAGPWNMPELDWAFGYPAVLGFMAAVVAGMIYWFRRRGWF